MSSTRANSTTRHKDDFYATPDWIVNEFLTNFKQDITKNLSYMIDILDPSVGGVVGKSEPPYPKAVLAHFENAKVHTLDIREDAICDECVNYMEWEANKEYNMIITNPPFNQSIGFINKALDEVCNGGYVVMLQRLNFLGSAKRKPFWENAPLLKIYVHHKRASFTGDGKSDSIEYCHYVFQKGYTGEPTIAVI